MTHVPEESRYELRLDGRLIGLADYRRSDGRIVLTHTEVEETLRRRGFAGRLVKAALQDALREGLDVVPLCPFVASYPTAVAVGGRRSAARSATWFSAWRARTRAGATSGSPAS